MISLVLAELAVTDPLAATEAYMATLSAEASTKSDAYFTGGYWLQLWSFLLGLAVAWLMLAGKRSARVKNWLQRKVHHRLVIPLYSAIYLLASTLLLFPYSLYADYFREKNYDLLNLGIGAWINEQIIGLLVGMLFFAIAVTLLYAIIRKLGKLWIWWGSGAMIILLAFMIMIYPVFIAPLFNEYQPLEEEPLRTQILSMAEANGIPSDDVYVYDGSRQSDRVTANVSGFMGTTRISLADTLLDQATPEGVKAVMGHEMGHYALGHRYETLIYMGLVILIGFIFSDRFYSFVQIKYGTGWGIGRLDDIAGLPLFLAVFSIYMFLAAPVMNRITYSNEVEADIYGLNAARQPDGFAQTALLLAKYRKMQPGPLEEAIFFTHPSGYNRIKMAMNWKAAQGRY